MERKFIPVNPIFVNRSPVFELPGVGDILEKGGKFIENAFSLMVSDALDIARGTCVDADRERDHYNNVSRMIRGNGPNHMHDGPNTVDIRRYMEIPRDSFSGPLPEISPNIYKDPRQMYNRQIRFTDADDDIQGNIDDMIGAHFARRQLAQRQQQQQYQRQIVDDMYPSQAVQSQPTPAAQQLLPSDMQPSSQPLPPATLVHPDLIQFEQPKLDMIPVDKNADTNISESNIRMSAAQTRSIIHGDMKDSKIVYVNLLGRDISVLVKRKSGKKELEFYRGGDSIPADMINLDGSVNRSRTYVGEFGMKVITSEKKSILDILHRMNLLDDCLLKASNADAKADINVSGMAAVAFIIPTGAYDKINWSIPDYLLRGRKIWIFSPGNEIAGGDAICGHEVYDTFVSHN